MGNTLERLGVSTTALWFAAQRSSGRECELRQEDSVLAKDLSCVT